MRAMLTPNEVAALAGAPRTVVEKAIEQKVLIADRRARERVRQLPLHAVAVAATVKSLGRRLSIDDKRRVAQALAQLSPADLKTAEIEVAPALIVHVGRLSRSAVERAERYAAARDAHIETAEGVQGGRPVIRGTRITVSAIHGRLGAGDTIDDLVEDYPDVPREAFEAAFLYAETHPQVGRPPQERAA
ncbi:MAG: DUF433 domain-containing protein [Alphaproteobacteria bacterium]